MEFLISRDSKLLFFSVCDFAGMVAIYLSSWLVAVIELIELLFLSFRYVCVFVARFVDGVLFECFVYMLGVWQDLRVGSFIWRGWG